MFDFLKNRHDAAIDWGHDPLTDLSPLVPDKAPEADGDDSILELSQRINSLLHEGSFASQSLSVVSSPSSRPFVPYVRELKRGARGRDVLAVQRAIANAGFRKWGVNFTGAFGSGLEKDIKEFQKKNKLPVDGVYGPRTHLALARYFDSYGAAIMQKLVPKGLSRIEVAVKTAMLGYYKRSQIYYTQGASRMMGVTQKIVPPNVPTWADCSSFVTWCYWVAKLPDPNGLGYNGFGYTGTLAVNGQRVATPKVGDLALYGPGLPYRHVTICVGFSPDGSPMVVSHGSSGGPYYLAYNYRSDFSHWRRYV